MSALTEAAVLAGDTIERLQADRDAQRARADALQADCDKWSRLWKDTAAERDQARMNEATAVRASEVLAEQRDQARAERDAARARVAELEHECERRAREISGLQSKLADALSGGPERALTALRAQVATLTAERDREAAESGAAFGKLEGVRRERDAALARVAELEGGIDAAAAANALGWQKTLDALTTLRDDMRARMVPRPEIWERIEAMLAGNAPDGATYCECHALVDEPHEGWCKGGDRRPLDAHWLRVRVEATAYALEGAAITESVCGQPVSAAAAYTDAAKRLRALLAGQPAGPAGPTHLFTCASLRTPACDCSLAGLGEQDAPAVVFGGPCRVCGASRAYPSPECAACLKPPAP